jgi:DNA-3-methyladenine glycosylase I
VTAGIVRGADGVARCWWSSGDPLYLSYHDDEWGRPSDDDVRLFEKLCLEGFMAGLSWLTILRKRESFRKAFKGFDIEAVSRFGSRDVSRLLNDAAIVRHRGKIEATINNARRCLDLQDEVGSLAAYAWSYEPGPRSRPKRMTHAALTKLTASPEAKEMSKDLRKRGWGFVGPTTVYSFMEAMGLVNDHLEGCDLRQVVEKERKGFRRPSSFGTA